MRSRFAPYLFLFICNLLDVYKRQLKHRGDKLYFNLFTNEIRTATADVKDTVKGELVFRGKVGQHIEEKRDKKDQPYTCLLYTSPCWKNYICGFCLLLTHRQKPQM